MAAEGGTKKIFISHAAEDPEWTPAKVEALAEELKAAGCEVLLDLWFDRNAVFKPSDLQWWDWMAHAFARADHILCLCSKHYAELASAVVSDGTRGRGVAYEAVELQRRVSKSLQRINFEMLVALPRKGTDESSIPHFLLSRCPTYYMDADRRRLINDLGGAEKSDEALHNDASVPMFEVAEDKVRDQQKLVGDLLCAEPVYWGKLKRDDGFFFDDRSGEESRIRPRCLDSDDPHDFAVWLSSASTSEARLAMVMSLRAFKEARETECDLVKARRITVAIYCLAACRFVDLDSIQRQREGRLVRVPDLANIYCAVVSTVLFGGTIEVVKSESSGRSSIADLRHPAAYSVRLGAAGLDAPYALERAAFDELCPDAASEHPGGKTGPLDETESGRLRKAIANVKNHLLSSISLLVLDRNVDPKLCQAFADTYYVPTFMLSESVAHGLMGMSVTEFRLEFEQLSRVVGIFGSAGSDFSEAAMPVAPAPPSHVYNIHNHQGTVALASGVGSVSQAGAQNSSERASERPVPRKGLLGRIIQAFKDES